MELEQWQVEALDSVIPLDGLIVEQTRAIVRWFVFDPNPKAPAEVEEALQAGAPEDRRRRMFLMGVECGRAMARKPAGGTSADPAEKPFFGLDPSLATLFDDVETGPPDPTAAYTYTETALLKAIQGRAQADPSADELRLLAQAFAALCGVYPPATDGDSPV